MEKLQKTNKAAAAAIMLSLALMLGVVAAPQQAFASAAGDKIAQAAASVSYSQSTYKGEGTGTKAYLAACKKYLGSYYTKNQKQMQCNVPVALSVRMSGVNKKFPNTNTGMYDYMVSSADWECLGNYNEKTSMLEPGDVLIRIKGTTTYTDKKTGEVKQAATNHACVYVGKGIAGSVYSKTLKGTDADKGAPGKSRVFAAAHVSNSKPPKRSASCLETAKQAYADYRMIVFRYVGAGGATAGAGAANAGADQGNQGSAGDKAQPAASAFAASGKGIAQAAASTAYSRITYKSKGTGTDAYLAACKSILGKYYSKNQKQMQSNVPVALAVRTAVDGKFPTSTKAMYKYMKKSSDWKCLGNYNGKTSSLKPGDVLIRVKGTTTYKNSKGKTKKATANHACIYVGKSVAGSVYKTTLKKTDADKGKPGKSRVFVTAHKSSSKPSKRTAACLETAKQAQVDTKMIVFRYVG